MSEEKIKPEKYEPPKVTTFSSEDLVEKLGPSIACSFGTTVVRRGH